MTTKRIIAVIDPELDPLPIEGVVFKTYHDCEDFLIDSQNETYDEIWIIHDLHDRADITSVVEDLETEAPYEPSNMLIVFMTDFCSEVAEAMRILEPYHPVVCRPLVRSLFASVRV